MGCCTSSNSSAPKQRPAKKSHKLLDLSWNGYYIVNNCKTKLHFDKVTYKADVNQIEGTGSNDQKEILSFTGIMNNSNQFTIVVTF